MTTPRSLPQQPSVRRHVLARDEPQLAVPDVTPSPGSVLLSHRPPSLTGDGPEVSVVPQFTSTAGHSDFSHGIGDDFTFRLIRPPTQPRRTGPYEISRGNTWNFRAVPPAHTLLRPGTPSTSFAAVVPARYHLNLADRFANLGYGPALCRKPFRPHLTMGALSCEAVTDTATPTSNHRDAPSCHAQRGITPAFGYGPRLGPVRLDFHQLVPCAARRTLRAGPPAGAATVLSASGFRPRRAPSHPLLALNGEQQAVSAPAFPRSMQEPQTRLAPPPCRTPPGQYSGTRQAHPGISASPRFRCRLVISARQQRFASARLSGPHLTHQRAPFPRRSPRRSSANAARGGLTPPPEGRRRRATKPSSPAPHRIKKDYLPTGPPLRARGAPQNDADLASA